MMGSASLAGLFLLVPPCQSDPMTENNSDAIQSPNGTQATPWCFGTMQFGGRASAAESARMYAACRAAGINFFDTAHVYTDGMSETLLGKFAGKEREELIIATKCAFDAENSRNSILKSFDESRTRLGMDSVEILYLHRWSDVTPLEESLETLAQLRQQGKIRHIGVSNFSAWQVMKARCIAEKLATSIRILQPMYNLVKRQAEVEILPMAKSEGFAVAAYSPLGGGLLTGKYGAGKTGRLVEDKGYAARYQPEWMHRAANALAKLASDYGLAPATLAVAWVAHNDAVTAPILSARNAEQLAPSLAAMTLPLPPELYQAISRLSPTPPPATDRLEEA